ncbi:DNA-directed RNA polymerase subunit delta [Metamycoplasma hyosynoviae]|uniref:Uncharacterized protein n=1 Tax=Metamycoplasma hyosynoviae TaxID=29559 RepID=A0A063Y9J3_9BACT|nr:hypothetical protein [Metamycoplasma hyosynoviae]ASI53630.1 hypothetical protein MHSN_00070 [Metamycoplasma hyosynoviae]KDE42123.1 hypothetical protein NPL3_01945 [Metamycoplasma hyosynoviae]KDE42270.1 hypothetical protein NPL7_00760 [Metamycoplasma hyosynoviae]KDE42409.1 hypothetical protein NPL1_03655 [Metamycoplasma hyosynoviae]KDE43927.1 hypothetical protein NPL6_02705 [Metamycoplasma hyosynoviae]
MKYATMTEIAYQILLERKTLTFDELFNSVKNVLLETWNEELSANYTIEQIIEKKRGELYKLLTIDSKFFRNNDETWTSIRPDKPLQVGS